MISHLASSLRESNLVDNITLMLERYSTRLEEIVELRTKELEQEKQRSEDLLLKILPKRISDQLKVGRYVRAEEFESVSIYFSDIVDFTAIASVMAIHEVVDFLSDLYSLFDSITEKFNVCKIDTIGDSYQVCVCGFKLLWLDLLNKKIFEFFELFELFSRS